MPGPQPTGPSLPPHLKLNQRWPFWADQVPLQPTVLSDLNVAVSEAAITSDAPSIYALAYTVNVSDTTTVSELVELTSSIVSTELEYHLSGGAGNSNTTLSIGGAIANGSITSNVNDNVWSDVTSLEASSGSTSYSCLYVRNDTLGGLTWKNVVIWIDAQPLQGNVAIGLDSAAIGSTASSSSADVHSAPSPSISFSAPSSVGSALSIGDIPPGAYKAIWLRRTILAGSSMGSDGISVRCEGDNDFYPPAPGPLSPPVVS